MFVSVAEWEETNGKGEGVGVWKWGEGKAETEPWQVFRDLQKKIV